MKKFSGIVFIQILTVIFTVLSAAPMQDLGAFSNVRSSAARMPFYKNSQLEYYLRGDSMVLRGRQIDVQWPLIDLVRKGISVDIVLEFKKQFKIYGYLQAEIHLARS